MPAALKSGQENRFLAGVESKTCGARSNLGLGLNFTGVNSNLQQIVAESKSARWSSRFYWLFFSRFGFSVPRCLNPNQDHFKLNKNIVVRLLLTINLSIKGLAFCSNFNSRPITNCKTRKVNTNAGFKNVSTYDSLVITNRTSHNTEGKF